MGHLSLASHLVGDFLPGKSGDRCRGSTAASVVAKGVIAYSCFLHGTQPGWGGPTEYRANNVHIDQ